ncbi:glycosyltransferase family 2 protein [Cytobacillus oceanisediminis]|uniref:glycosyltransferase family 2 protein n=1 Tax=Cytobacillus oceanisediminis TaxID=665099 RepID=UPI0024940A05|nr:glycosyltransferase [Cytobacillus oceanisediminis]
MKKFNMIFCVLTYKNYTDVIDFINSIKSSDKINFSYKIIIVNNFADERSLEEIRKIAISNDCDFIENENKGYGHGNNVGITFARSNYEFDYIVVCNPDTEIKQFDFKSLKGQEKNIIGPDIICKNGKRQNPMYYKYMPISEKIVYSGFKNDNKILLFIGISLNKLNRYLNNLLTNLVKKRKEKIYACHGSYIIFSKYAINKLYPVFDENIFLFCEESILAIKAKKNNIEIILNKDIVIYHKEDGSMNLSNSNLSKIQKKSFLYYYNNRSNI